MFTKIVLKVRQYGLYATIVQVTRAIIRRIYQVDRNNVFVIPQFGGHEFSDQCIHTLTYERIVQASKDGALSKSDTQLLTEFLKDGNYGFLAEVNGKFAGYAWMQFDGLYHYGRAGRMTIPPKHVVVKNLLVFPDFRGHKLGPKLNSARLGLITAGNVPVVFIIPENRYAIRNWEQHGFQCAFAIKHWRWFGGKWQMKIDRLADNLEADALEQALINGHNLNRQDAST